MHLVGWLTGWLAGWLAVWLSGSLAACMVGWLNVAGGEGDAAGEGEGWKDMMGDREGGCPPCLHSAAEIFFGETKSVRVAVAADWRCARRSHGGSVYEYTYLLRLADVADSW
jgi:hypothetical protein